MTEAREVVVVIRRALLIHFACIPVALHRHSLRPPMRPDADLRIAKLFRARIIRQ
jgi:hypothetical protein